MTTGTDQTREHKLNEIRRLLKNRAEQQRATWELSGNQQAMRFLQELDPSTFHYNLAFVAGLKQAVDTAAMARAFERLIARHELLRAIFPKKEGRFIQEIAGFREGDFRVREVGRCSLDELERLVREEYERPFDLERDPPVRLTLLRMDESQSVVVLASHHIVNDFWGQLVLVTDLVGFYDQEIGVVPYERSEDPVSYSEFVREEALKLQGESGEALAKYWESMLRPLPDRIKLPTSSFRQPAHGMQAATHMFELPKELAIGIRELSRQLGVTPYSVYLSSLAALLQRYGNDDIIVGTALTVRDTTRFSNTMGNFVQILPVRIQVGAETKFKALLQQVRERVLGAMEHVDYPFTKLVEKLAPPRELGRSPLFDVMFVYQKPHMHLDMMKLYLGIPDETGVKIGSLVFSPFRLAQNEGQVDLTFEVVEWGEKVSVLIKYRQDRMNNSIVSRLQGHWLNLLRAFVGNPSSRVFEPCILEEGERESILAQCVGSKKENAADLLVLDWFERSVASFPNHEAVVVPAIEGGSERKAITYADLDAKSSLISAMLTGRGVKVGDAVVVHMARGVELVAVILGILKSGAAYVPVDQTYPQERISWILKDSDAALMVTDKHLSADGSISCPVVQFEELFSQASHIPSNKVDRRGVVMKGSDRAYLMYTSGSTGKPKGVGIAHASLANLLSTTPTVCDIQPSQIWSMVHSVGFDLSVLEMWGALSSGGTVVVMPSEVVKDPERLRATLLTEKVSIMVVTPSLARQMLKVPDNSTIPCLSRVLFCGEALTPDVADGCRDWGSDVYNLYGPTEATVFVSALKYQKVASACSSVPVGSPLPNTAMIVVDSKWNIVPRDVAGELCLLGDSLALGYHNQPILNEVAFPSVDVPGIGRVRLYRTGDTFMLHDSGDLEFLGRRDFQVKINGHRVELGEVEAVIASHTSVKQVAAIVIEWPEKVQRILACVVANDDSLTASGILRYVEEQLPAYLIPARIVFLPELPINSHGKLDRKRLSQIMESERTPPIPLSDITANEGIVLGVWEEVLRSSVTSLDANFFEMGGSSLLMIEVSSRLRSAGFDVKVIDLFRYPTVRRLAAHFDKAGPQITRSNDVTERLTLSRSRLALQRSRRGGRA